MSNREPLYTYGNAEIQKASDRITDNIEKLNEYIQDLEEAEEKLGTKGDTRDMRKRMNDKKYKANELVKQTKDLMNELKDAQPRKADDKEFKNKVLRRLNDNFTNEHNKFTKLLKSLALKEKRFIENKKSMLMESRLKGSVASDRSGYSQEEETELAAQIQDLDYTETLLKDREGDIQDVRKLAYELNLTAQFQAQKVAEASNDIEVMDNDTGFTEKKTEEALKNLDKVYEQQQKTSKKNLLLCCVVTFICAIIVAVVVSQMTSS